MVFPEHSKNKFIDGKMTYVIYGDYKHNIILGRDFNTWLVITMNDNFWMEAARDIMEQTMICVMIYIPRASYKELQLIWVRIDTIWYHHICTVMPCTPYK